jgi:hypothetical protein
VTSTAWLHAYPCLLTSGNERAHGTNGLPPVEWAHGHNAQHLAQHSAMARHSSAQSERNERSTSTPGRRTAGERANA